MKLALSVAAIAVLLAAALLVLRPGRDAASASRHATAPATAANSAPDVAIFAPLPSNAAPATERSSDERAVVEGPVAKPKPTRWTPTLLRVRVVSAERGEAVVDESVAALEAGASNTNYVSIGQWHGKPSQAPSTNAEGIVEFAVEAGVAYRVCAARFRATPNPIDVPPLTENEVREVVLTVATAPNVVVHGRVVDEETRRAIASATVRCDRQRGSHVQPGMQVQAAGDGSFELRLCSWIWYEASASAEGYAGTSFDTQASDGLAELSIEVRLPRVATLEVTVRDVKRAPLHAQVEATQRDEHWAQATDDDGHAVLAGVPANTPLQLSVRAGGRGPRLEPERITLASGETRRVEIVIGSGATIAGRVESTAVGSVAGLEVQLLLNPSGRAGLIRSFGQHMASVRTDENGGFVFDDVRPGSWLVGVPVSRAVERALSGRPPPESNDAEAEPPSDSDLACSVAQPVEVEPGADRIDIVLRIERAGYLRGSVLDPLGVPVPQCVVHASLSNTSVSFLGNTDELGNFAIGLAPAGAYLLSADAVTGAYMQSTPVAARAGEANIVLRLRAGATIGGRVVDAGGTLRAGEVHVCLTGPDADCWIVDSSDGTWNAGGLSPGLYNVYALSADGLCVRVTGIELHAGETRDDVELVVVRGAHLKIRYDGNDPDVTAELRIDGDQLGFFMFGKDADPNEGALPSGDFELRWVDGDENVVRTQRFTLAAGDDREIAWNGRP